MTYLLESDILYVLTMKTISMEDTMKKFDLIKQGEETLIIQNDQTTWGEDNRPVYGLITQSTDKDRIGKIVPVDTAKAKKIGVCRFNVSSTWNNSLPY